MNSVILVFVVVIFVFAIFYFSYSFLASILFRKTVYLDEGKGSKIFYNEKYLISGKPDRLESVYKGVVDLYEYKSRMSDIYDHDKVQAVCAAIAVSSVYRVRMIVIENGRGKREKLFFRSVDKMYAFVRSFHEQSKLVTRGDLKSLRYKPRHYKCSGCSVRSGCDFKV